MEKIIKATTMYFWNEKDQGEYSKITAFELGKDSDKSAQEINKKFKIVLTCPNTDHNHIKIFEECCFSIEKTIGITLNTHKLTGCKYINPVKNPVRS